MEKKLEKWKSRFGTSKLLQIFIKKKFGTHQSTARAIQKHKEPSAFQSLPQHPDATHRSILNKPKQTINNGGCCVAIDVHGFANLHRHLNTANPTCSCLAAISDMAVQSFCRLVGHSNPAPSPWRKRFFFLAQQCFGATYEPLFLVRSWCFGCQKTKSGFETRLWLLVVSKLNKFISSVMFFPWHVWKSIATVNCLVTYIIQNNIIICCVPQKKEVYAGLE